MKKFVSNVGSFLVALFVFAAFWTIMLATGVASRSLIMVIGAAIFAAWIFFSVKKKSVLSAVLSFFISFGSVYLIWGFNFLIGCLMAIENSIIKDLSLGLLIVVFVIIVLILWKKIRKRICIVPTNKFLIIQGMLKNGFYTSNKNFLGHVDCLGKTFIRWFDFLYKFEKDQNGKPIFDELPTKVQIIKLEKKVDDKKAEVEAITKDHKPIGVIGLFEFQIEDPLIFLNLLWKGSLEETLKYAQEIFSPIIETHLEPVIRTYMLSTDDGHSIDQLKTEIGENALKNALG